MDNVKLVFAVIGLLVLAVMLWILFGFYKQWVKNYKLRCQRGEAPHNWSLWKPAKMNKEGICSTRQCRNCGLIESTKRHTLVRINYLKQADCEPEIYYCRECEYVEKRNSETEHNFEQNDGFSVLKCKRCNREYPLL